jgi:hypothetical protein
MKNMIFLLVLAALLSGCSAASLKKAEETTRVSAMTVPIVGGLIWAPIWVASKIAGTGEQAPDEAKNNKPSPENDPYNEDGTLKIKGEKIGPPS